MPNQLDETRAYSRAEQHIRDAADALGVEVRLNPLVRNAVGVGRREGGRRLVNVEVSYECLTPEPEGDIFERNAELFERLDVWRQQQGYLLVKKDNTDPFRMLTISDPHDEFVVSMRQGTIGNLAFTVSSPPVPETGIDPPPPGLT